ncbi:MAG: TonB-dependent receptor [Gammaproteobacteria bacterium]
MYTSSVLAYPASLAQSWSWAWLTSVVAMLIVAMPQLSQAQTPETEIEEVVVTGILGSLKSSTNLKRNENRIVDAIVAEDIGKLPDNNIAEALQRITGVSISRDFGIGDTVSIRGLTQNRVELNGRTTSGDGRGGISLQDFPSSFLKQVEVIKSPTADMIEGALGGTVRMSTIRPLDLDKFTIAGSLDYEFADKTEEWAPIANIAVGQKWETASSGTFGLFASLATQDRTIRQDEFFSRIIFSSDEDFAGNAPQGNFTVRDQNTVQQFVENRDRTASNITFEYESPSQNVRAYADLTSTDRAGYQDGSSILEVGGAVGVSASTTQDGGGQVSNYTLTDAFAIPKSWNGFRETEFSSQAFGAEWELNDQMTISGEFSTSSSSTHDPMSEFNLRSISQAAWQTWHDQYDQTDDTTTSFDESCDGLRHCITGTITQSGDSIPSIIWDDQNAFTGNGPNGDQTLAIRAFYHDDDRIENDETAYRFDFEYSEVAPWVTSLKAGARFTSSGHSFDRLRYRANNLYKDAYTDAGTASEKPLAYWLDDWEAMFPGTIRTINHPNSFSQTGLTGTLDHLNYRIFDARQLSNPESVFQMVQEAFAGTGFAVTGSLADNLERQLGSFRDVSEDTTALYVSAEMETGELTAVAGLRFVGTDITSSVYSNHDADSDTPEVLTTGSHNYSDLLPSVNIGYNLTNDLKLRFAYADVMRRPDYSELSPALEIDNSYVTATQGAIDLDPYRTSQIDFSLEWYLAEGALLSVASYSKDVESFLTSTTTCEASNLTVDNQNVTEWENVCLLTTAGQSTSALNFATAAQGEAHVTAEQAAGRTGIRTSRTTNGENGTVDGLEISYQQQFVHARGRFLQGLGVIVNLTTADSEQPNGNSLLGISDTTYNLQVYWENDKFHARFAYNYRDSYLFTEEEKRVERVGALGLGSATNDTADAAYDRTAGNNYRNARGQLDFSGAWNVQENVTVVGTITNLLGEPESFDSQLGSPWRYYESDRRLAIGFRAKY